MKRSQPDGLARARAAREAEKERQRGVVALERIATALERMLATNARVMFFPRPANAVELRDALARETVRAAGRLGRVSPLVGKVDENSNGESWFDPMESDDDAT